MLREGTKKTVFVNLIEICKGIHRNPDHVVQYMMAELGTSGTLDGQNRLITKGRFTPKVRKGLGLGLGFRVRESRRDQIYGYTQIMLIGRKQKNNP